MNALGIYIRKFIVENTFEEAIHLKEDAGFRGFVLPTATLDCLRHATDGMKMFELLERLQYTIFSGLSASMRPRTRVPAHIVAPIVAPIVASAKEPAPPLQVQCVVCKTEQTCDQFSNTQLRKNVGRETCKSCCQKKTCR